MNFDLHTKETSPRDAVALLEASESAYGWIPNLHAVMAESPALLQAYQQLTKLFGETSLSPIEQQVVLLEISRANACTYCVAAHSVVASMANVSDDVVTAIRDDDPIGDAKLEALRRMTRTLVEKRGLPDDADLQAFADAGYGSGQLFEVILGIGLKTLSNYVNHVADTPLDDAFAAAAWPGR